MKTLAAGVLLATTIFTPAIAAEIKSTSVIDAVTVFPQGAQVTRVANFHMPAGDNTIILEDLPADVIAGSLRVEGEAQEAMAIGSVDSRKVYITNVALAATQRMQIENEIQKLVDTRTGLEDAVSAAMFRKRVVEGIATRSLQPAHLNDGEARSPEPDWNALLVLVSDQLSAINAEIRELEIKQRAISKNIVELEKQLAAKSPLREKRTEIAVHVSANGARSGKLVLHYQVAQARWIPTYDARLETANAQGKPSMKLVHLANVVQRTGETWDNVALKLSTSRPRGATSAPRLDGLRVQIIDAYRPQASAPALHKRKMLDAARESDDGNIAGAIAELKRAKPVKMDQVPATFVPTGFQVVYEIGGKASIGNTGQVKKVRIRESRHTPQLSVQSVPVLDQSAYLYANFSSEPDTDVLAGPVALYRDGVFVGNGKLPHLAPKTAHKLGFGPDDAVRVKRIEIDRMSGETGILTTSNQDSRSFKIIVENHHKTPMPVVIFDRLPYAENEDIQVELLSGTTKPTRRNDQDRRGVLAWEINMKPDQKSDLRFGYSITWPRNVHINLAAR